MDETDQEANEILKRELEDKWEGWTYEQLLPRGFNGYTHSYLQINANYEGFSSSAKIDVVLKLAKIDLKK